MIDLFVVGGKHIASKLAFSFIIVIFLLFPLFDLLKD
jgi:hypothetical protein